MIAHVFSPFIASTDTFASNFIGTSNNILNFDIKKSRQGVGSFTITILCSDNLVNDIDCDYIMYIKEDNAMEHWLIIRNIRYNGKDNTCTISGTDAKGLLSNRITLYNDANAPVGTQGFDVVQGTTEYCCNHYVKNNLINTTDSNRKIQRLRLYNDVAQDSGVGLATDTYMSRFEYVSDVVEKLCRNANLSWDVWGSFENNCFYFGVFAPVDRSAAQNITNQIVFSRERKNITDLVYEKGNEDYKNVLYATKSGGTLVSDAVTVLVAKGNNPAAGVTRKETQINVSCDDVSEIETYALHEAQDFSVTEKLTANVTDLNGYESGEYEIGDRITIADKILNVRIDTNLVAISVSKSKEQETVTIELGDEQPKPLRKIYNRINNKGV